MRIYFSKLDITTTNFLKKPHPHILKNTEKNQMKSNKNEQIKQNPFQTQPQDIPSTPQIKCFFPIVSSFTKNNLLPNIKYNNYTYRKQMTEKDLTNVKIDASGANLNKNARSLSPEEILESDRRIKIRKRNESKRRKLLQEYKELNDIGKKGFNFEGKMSCIPAYVCFEIIESLHELDYLNYFPLIFVKKKIYIKN